MTHDRAPMPAAPGPHQPTDAALADAEAVLDRIRADEDAARNERERLQSGGLARVAVGREIALDAGEDLVDTRAAVRIEQIDAGAAPMTGRLLLTTHRLVLAGRDPLELDITMIDEISLVGERLLLALRGGIGLRLDLSSPRVFRVRLAHSIAQRRSDAEGVRELKDADERRAIQPSLAIDGAPS